MSKLGLKFKNLAHDLSKAFKSKYSIEKKSAYGFVISFLLMIFAIGVGTQSILKKLKPAPLKPKEQIVPQFHTAALGHFTLELIQVPGEANLNTAEMEIHVICETQMTCDYLTAHLAHVRGQLSSLFLPTLPTKLFSLAGKRAFRGEIKKIINGWLESLGKKGEVKEALLPYFVIS